MMMQLRKLADEMVTVGKQGTLFARRRAQAVLRSDESIAKVFDVLAPRYKDRAGGYTRVLRCGGVLFWLM
jgi:large subunit ribosomal protein L17